MTEPPRRLMRTVEADRNRTVGSTHTAQSGQGQTRAAGPVTGNARKSTVYQPPKPPFPVTVGNTAGQTDAVAITSTNGSDSGSTASAPGAVAVGTDSFASGAKAVAVGFDALADHDYSGAIGAETVAQGVGSWAIGTDSSGSGAATSTQDVIKLGTSLHAVVIDGALVIQDTSHGRWQIVVDTSGNLSTVAWP